MARLLQPARSTIARDRLITNSTSGPDPRPRIGVICRFLRAGPYSRLSLVGTRF
jgi:hypothetical protein